MKWVAFVSQMMPTALELLRSVFDATKGDPAKSRAVLRRITDHWDEWDRVKGEQRERLDVALSGRSGKRGA